MPKLDEAKERLGILKFWLGVFVGVFVAIGGFLATHHKNATNDIPLFIFGICAEIILLLVIFRVNRKVKDILKEIRNLKK